LEAAVGERAMVSLDAIVAAGCMDVVAGQSAVVITIIVEDGGVAADEDAVAGILVDDAVFDRRKAGDDPVSKVVIDGATADPRAASGADAAQGVLKDGAILDHAPRGADDAVSR